MTDAIKSTLGTMSPQLLAKLSQLGWEPHRESKLDEYLGELSASGFKINPVAEQILESFGGCHFNLPDGGIGWFSFTITEARHTLKVDHLSILEMLIEEEAPCPVGAGGGYILFACRSGNVSLLQEEWLYLLRAHSLADILEAIVLNDRSHCSEVPNIEDYRPDW